MKNSKFLYYIQNIARYIVPDFFYQKQLDVLLKLELEDTYIQTRVNYYNKLTSPFVLSKSVKSIKEFKRQERKKTYFFDLLEYLRYFKNDFKISYFFGDITYIPDTPSFVKSRPIDGDNANSVLMNLNKIRHFVFVNDKVAFKDKKNILVWRGKAYKEHRQEFLKRFYNHPKCNVGQTNTKGDLTVAWQKNKMSLQEQLQYKFILSIEGNDVASNLKWIMSSNSLTFMTQPKFETWFMEGTLKANYHYVLLKDDYSDLEEKIDYYSDHSDKAHEIINNANTYVKQFKDSKREKLISLLVVKKYFEMSQ